MPPEISSVPFVGEKSCDICRNVTPTLRETRAPRRLSYVAALRAVPNSKVARAGTRARGLRSGDDQVAAVVAKLDGELGRGAQRGRRSRGCERRAHCGNIGSRAGAVRNWLSSEAGTEVQGLVRGAFGGASTVPPMGHRLTGPRRFHLRAGMAKLADAADLKSADLNRLWGFKSPSRYHKAFRMCGLKIVEWYF